MNLISILLVDDDFRLLRSLARDLTELEYDVTTTVSAIEASMALRQKKFDVVVSDHQMHGAKGLNFLNTLKSTDPGIARILLSGEVSPGCIQEATLRDTAHAVMHKPCQIDELHRAIQESIEKVAESNQPSAPVESTMNKLFGYLRSPARNEPDGRPPEQPEE